MPALPTDPSVLLAYPAFVFMLYLGANMMRRQRDTDARQKDLAQLQLQMSTSTMQVALDRETNAVARLKELEQETNQLRDALRRCNDDRARSAARYRGSSGPNPGSGPRP